MKTLKISSLNDFKLLPFFDDQMSDIGMVFIDIDGLDGIQHPNIHRNDLAQQIRSYQHFKGAAIIFSSHCNTTEKSAILHHTHSSY